MNYTFDWPNKIITPTDAPISGAITIDVQDMYSRWVDWMVTSDNAKYLQAMRVVWWDPLPWSKQLWITYFLLNGWKIRPHETNHIFSLDGNIYSEDWSSPFVPTLWAYNVTIINSVSNLVDIITSEWWGWGWGWLSTEEHNKLMSTVTFKDLIIANQL